MWRAAGGKWWRMKYSVVDVVKAVAGSLYPAERVVVCGRRGARRATVYLFAESPGV